MGPERERTTLRRLANYFPYMGYASTYPVKMPATRISTKEPTYVDEAPPRKY